MLQYAYQYSPHRMILTVTQYLVNRMYSILKSNRYHLYLCLLHSDSDIVTNHDENNCEVKIHTICQACLPYVTMSTYN